MLLLVGVLLRLGFDFFFPQQLAAFEEHPTLLSNSYNVFVAGNILLWPAIVTLATEIGKRGSSLALWGGCFTLFGLFARVFHGGIDYLAFQSVRFMGLERSTELVAESYGAFSIVSTLNGAILADWILLAIGAYRTQTLNMMSSVALALMSMLMLGVLKGSSWTSVVAVLGLVVAMVPFGVRCIRESPAMGVRGILKWLSIMLATLCVLYFLGQQG